MHNKPHRIGGASLDDSDHPEAPAETIHRRGRTGLEAFAVEAPERVPDLDPRDEA